MKRKRKRRKRQHGVDGVVGGSGSSSSVIIDVVVVVVDDHLRDGGVVVIVSKADEDGRRGRGRAERRSGSGGVLGVLAACIRRPQLLNGVTSGRPVNLESYNMRFKM